MEKFGKFTLNLLLSVGALSMGGITLVLLWKWFIFPLVGISIGFWHALGLDLTVSFLVGIRAKSDNDDKSYWEKTLLNIVMYAIVLCFGFVIQLFM